MLSQWTTWNGFQSQWNSVKVFFPFLFSLSLSLSSSIFLSCAHFLLWLWLLVSFFSIPDNLLQCTVGHFSCLTIRVRALINWDTWNSQFNFNPCQCLIRSNVEMTINIIYILRHGLYVLNTFERIYTQFAWKIHSDIFIGNKFRSKKRNWQNNEQRMLLTSQKCPCFGTEWYCCRL